MGPSAASRGTRISNSFPYLLPEEVGDCSLYAVKVKVKVRWGIGLEEWFRWFSHPLGGSVWRGQVQYPAFAPKSLLLLVALQKLQLGPLVCLYLLSRICPNWASTQLFLVPYSFFVFCCWRTGLSRCTHCSKRSQVLVCLSKMTLSGIDCSLLSSVREINFYFI